MQVGDVRVDELTHNRVRAMGAQAIMSVAGVTYRREALQSLEGVADALVTFEPEPDNAHDADAKKVLINGQHVGYVRRGRALPKHCHGVVKIQGGRFPCVWLAVTYS